MRNIFTRFMVVSLLLLVTATVSAQQTSLTAGKVYKFTNCSYSTKVLASNGADDTRAADAVDGEESQHWYCETETIDGTLYYKFRNLINGRYLAGNGTSSNWPLVAGDVETDTKYFTLETSGNYNVIRSKAHANDGYAYMHSDGSYNIVGWCTDANGNATSWTISEVEYTADDIASILGEINTMENEAAAVSTYQSYLDNIFADKACTTFKQGYVFSENESNYQALPATLKNMVKKVSSNDWTEANGNASKDEWGHKYAKKFRVQMYEPYSFAGYDNSIISFMRFDCHANNDNPTGIYAHERGNIYVMVQGEIKKGATLRLVDAGSNDRITNPAGKGYELKTGLNILPCYGQGGHFYVCYNVETYTPDTKEFNYKLSDFEPLKIHIEGGAITGFYNAQGDYRATAQSEDDLWYQNSGASVDCDEDWEYMETRANLSVVPVLGHRQILLFSLNTTNEGDNGMAYYLPENINIPTTPYNRTGKWSDFGLGIPDEGYEGYKVNIMMEAWDRIMYSELATMGLVSKDEMDRMNDLYPRWKADGSRAEMYDFNGASVVDGKTYQEFCEGRDYSEYFNHHGVALGVGGNAYMYGSGDHCGYHHNTMNGIIQNIAYTAGSTWGPAHEIGHQHQDTYLLNGQTEVTNNLFSNIALWYKGISTSRYNGNNGSLESVLNAFNTEGSDTYTNNIWALTHLYYRLWLYYHLAGNNTQFWPRLYELLRVDPLQNGGTISGDRSLLLFYKHACTAAGEDLTEFFRAHGFLSVMDNRLVGDYANAYYTVTQDMIDRAIKEVKAKGYEENLAILFINDDDETAQYVQHDGVSKREIYGETSPNSDFGSVSDFINGNVEVSTAYTASVSADGTVTMSGGEGGVGFLVLNEDGEIVSFSNKSTFAISDEAAYLLATGKASVVAVDTKSNTTDAEVDVTAMRFALLEELVENAIALTLNSSETRVGFYKPSAVENLQLYITNAQDVIANGDLANLQAVYELLYAEYNAVVANEYSRVTLVPSSKYAITSVKSNDRILTYSGSNVTTVSGNADDYSSTDAYQWYIERDGAYYIKNAGTSKYIQDVTDQNGVLYTVGDNKVNMNINEVALGCYTIATSNVPGRYMNMDGADATRIITWGDAYSENSQWAFILLDVDDTNAAKEKLLELSNKTLTLVNEVATISYDEGSKISLQSDDENDANYIWSNAAVSGNNVDKLLDGDKDTFFHSQWNNSTAPADGWGHHLTVDLGANSTLKSFKFKFTTRNQDGLSNYPKTIEVYGSNDNSTYTKLQVASGFATGAGVDNEAVVKGNGTAYRYLRFLVTDATGNNAGTNTGSDGMVFFHMSEFSIYPAVATVKEDYKSNITPEAVLAAYNDAEQGKTVYNNTDATLDDINARTTALGDGTTAGSYTTLLAQYNNVLNSVLEAKKTELLTLITNTNSLIESVGSVVVQGPQKVALAGKLYAHLPYTAGGTNDSDYSSVENNYNLLDGDVQTHFHSDYSANMPDVPYIRVDLGDGNEVKEFTFNYTTRSIGTGYPTTIKVYGATTQISYDDVKDSEPLATFTTSDANNAMPTSYGSWTSEDIVSETPYRYFVFAVTSSSVTKTHNNVTRPYFVMSEFGFTEGGSVDVNLTNTSTKVDEALLLDSYLATTKSQKLHDAATTVALLDAAIADQQAAYDKLDKAIKTPADLDKSALQTLYDEVSPYYTTAHELYASMTDANGNVNADYAPSTLTNEQLETAKTALDNVQAELLAAQTALDEATAQDEIDAAKEALNTAYEALKAPYAALLAVENANEKNTLATTDLVTLIEQVETLLGTIATDATEVKATIPLQTTAGSDYYIKAFETGDGSVANLIDKNTDGTGVTAGDSYYGSAWDPAPEAFSQYIEVDMGTAIRIDELLFDYTTRDGSQTTERPSAIRISGSNNGVDYTEVTTINEGLATGQCEQWTMTSPLALNRNYRYIRFTVDSERHSFHMSDFNLYALIDKQLKDYYTTATRLGFDELCLALQSAKDALTRHYLTSAQYTAIKEKLNSVYNDVNNVIALDYTTRDGLTTLITDTETLINKVATVNGYAMAVQLQCNDASAPNYLYCNAPGGSNTYDTDKAGVAALIDLVDGEPNLSTFIHTTYSGDDYYDDLDHYLRVDAGEGKSILAFKFNYNCRQGYGSNSPKVILIEGTNDLNEEFEEITTLSELPTDDNASYESALISNGKPYRYIRFMVKETKNDNSHPFFSMSHFGMTSCIDASISEDYPKVTPELLLNAYLEKSSATEAKNHYMNEADYTAAQEALQAAYDALNAATVADKTELNNLIEATRILKNNLYVIASYTANEITLSTKENEAGYLYCNAPETNSSSGTDNVGVAAAIDLTAEGEPNLDTFLHTEYGDDQSADGLDHYLRVDLGTDGATDYVEFGYYGRSGHETKSPKKVIVAATNDLTDGGVWTEIVTLNPAQASASTETKTGCLGNGVKYRYWRFLVEETHAGGKDGNNHQFFCMTQFNVYKCTNVEFSEQLKYTPTIYIHTTADLVTEVENAITTATGVSEDENVTPAGVETAVDALQAVYDKLEEALKYAGLPVTITTDEANPVLYKIISKRADDGSKVLQFDEPTTNKVAIVATADNASYQAWYFMKGDNGYLIKPFNGDGKMLGVSSTGDAQASASIAETATYKEWDFSRSTVTGCTDYFYIYVNGTSHACLSHNGGFNETDKLGIWASGWNTNDGGTLFKFVEATFDNDNARYYQLSDFENTLEYQTSVTPEGTTVGAFVNGNAYSTAYTTASTLIEAGNTSDAAACKDAYTALRTASESVARIEPEERKIYRIYITPGYTASDRAGASMRIDDYGKLACGVFNEEDPDSHYYFTFEYDGDGNLYMKNLHSATYLDEALTKENNNNVQVGADAEDIANAKKIAINTLGKSGEAVVIGIVPDGGDMLNCAGKPGNVIAFNNTAVDKASAWVIEEVREEEIANIGQTIKLNTAAGEEKSYSTLYSAYPVTLPHGIEASIITAKADNGLLTMETITDESNRVVPAYTAVILSQDKEDDTSVASVSSKVTFTTQETATVVAEGENMLQGTLFTEYIACGVDCADYRVYTLGRKNDKVAMYWAYANYKLENGVYAKLTGEEANSDKGGYVKMGANKAYLKIGTNGDGASEIPMFSFWFGGETTGVGGVDADAVVDGIYDLQGRKIEEVTAPGFYIVNGKKVYISDVE